MVTFRDRQRSHRGRSVVGTAGGLGLVVALSVAGTSGAQAQNCTLGPNDQITNLAQVGSSPAAVAGMIGTTLASAQTAFLLQSTAFIGSPPNPGKDQQGGGIWVRGVGGTVDVKSSTYTSVSVPEENAQSFVSCTQKVRSNFAGVQLGTDIARLDVNGWNVHAGVTGGYMQTKNNLTEGAFAFLDPASVPPGAPAGGGSFDSTTQIPFLGAYAAATYGGFFIDGLLRAEYYQTSLNAPGVNLFNQSLDARGLSLAASIGYNWKVPNSNWFIEPSAGLILSRTVVDPFTYRTAGTVSVDPGPPEEIIDTRLAGTLKFQDIHSKIGRVGLRTGTTIDGGAIIWQPFAAASVWREFGPTISSTYQSCPECVNVDVAAASTTSTIGTFGQYSLGFSAAVANTGWLGFARVDYRKGSHLEGVSGTGGIRYQFTPGAVVRMPVKTKGPAPVVEVVNWSGFYIGAFGGGMLGSADWNHAAGSAKPNFGGSIWGAEVGYNIQNGAWVYGLAADWGMANLKGGTTCGPNFFDLNTRDFVPMFQMTCNASAHWIATATGRLGVAWDRTMVYVKGGGAWTQLDVAATCNLLDPLVAPCKNPAGAISTGLTAGSNRVGVVAGLGTEFALTRNWSAKAEYDYIHFGNHDVTASDGSILNIGMNASQVRVGLNYRPY